MQAKKAIKAKWLIDGTGNSPIENPVVMITGNKIEEIGRRGEFHLSEHTTVIDLSEQILMPGMIDAHTHFFGVPIDQAQRISTDAELDRVLVAARDAKKMLEYGITSARCLGSSISPALKKAIDEGSIPGPRVVVSGEFICSTNGTWDMFDIPLKGMIIDGAESMRQVVRERIQQGAGVIKVGLSKGRKDDRNHAWGDDPYTTIPAYSLVELEALTQEAHANALKVSAHCIGDAAVRLAIKGGVDTIEHGFGITDETRAMLSERQIPVVTTFSNLYYHQLFAEPFQYSSQEKATNSRHMEVMRADFEKGLKAGVHYVLGTDLMGEPTHPLHLAAKEFELAVAWGMSPMDAIQSGSKFGAEVLGIDHLVGTIEQGKLADIIALTINPLEDIRALQDVSFVMKDGHIIVS